MFFINFILFYLFYNYIFNFFFLNMQSVFFFNFFFLIFFFLNFFFLNLKNTKFNLDIFLCFFKINKLNLINYYFLELYKFILFTIKIKFIDFLKTLNIFFKFFYSNIFLIWRPLFKKWSYFGYFRSNRSKWIK